MWIAFELVSSSYWKQRIAGKGKQSDSCELLSNLYLRHIENNTVAWRLSSTSVVNCFRTCIFVILKTTIKNRNFLEISCELLSNLYLRHIENNSKSTKNYGSIVVNCFRTCIFVILKTTHTWLVLLELRLWIAFELVSSSYWKQQMDRTISYQYVVNCFRTCIFVILKTTDQATTCQENGCELLSNLYLRHIENNVTIALYQDGEVVNCFRTCIFVILKTT